MERILLINQFGDRTICLKGVGKLFYQYGLPISVSIQKLKEQNIEISYIHMIEEFWDNGWSWQTIESKLKEEIQQDIDKVIDLDFNYLKAFYDCLEQPKRSNGGYEESREIIFQYLFNTSTDSVRNEENTIPLNWLRQKPF